jgi:hypothetical protein
MRSLREQLRPPDDRVEVDSGVKGSTEERWRLASMRGDGATALRAAGFDLNKLRSQYGDAIVAAAEEELQRRADKERKAVRAVSAIVEPFHNSEAREPDPERVTWELADVRPDPHVHVPRKHKGRRWLKRSKPAKTTSDESWPQ